MHYDKQQKRIYLQRWTSISFLVHTILANTSHLDPVHLRKATKICKHQSRRVLLTCTLVFRTLPEIVLAIYTLGVAQVSHHLTCISESPILGYPLANRQWKILLSLSLPKIGIASCHASRSYMRESQLLQNMGSQSFHHQLVQCSSAWLGWSIIWSSGKLWQG